MFVGRRRELQKALRALRESDHVGVLLHGMGRLGKSSLAFRIANRRRDLRLAVVFEHYGALAVLAPLSEAAQRKLELRQKEAAADEGLTGKAFDEREAMLARVPGIARGNPGLQDLIGRRLVLSAAVAMDRARRTLDEMEAWLKQGDLPSDADVRAFLENLAVDSLLELAGKAGQAVLRRLTLFDLPVPEGVAEKLAAMDGASLRHL